MSRKIDSLEAEWEKIETAKAEERNNLVRMVCSHLLFRVYIGVAGIPSKRYVIFEIPETEKKQFKAFIEPKGFSLVLDEAVVRHKGYVSCVIQVSLSENNDVFSIVIQDIIDEISACRDSDLYVARLRRRIEKWREFFRNSEQRRLSDEKAIGLFGELMFMKQALEAGIVYIPDLWNGPLRASQDYQSAFVAVEIKTVSSSAFGKVHISSEMQLDGTGYNQLFLNAYRVERNDVSGVKLPDLVEAVAEAMAEEKRNRYYAKLLCLGYDPQKAHEQYDKGYTLRESRTYLVEEGFPRVTPLTLPRGISDVEYELNLQECKPFVTVFENALNALKES